jgi:hypothetical protein
MISKAAINKEIKAIEKEAEKKLKEVVEEFTDRIQIMSPVDTGNLKDNFQEPKKTSKGYKIINSAPYATSILIYGRREEDGKMVGSEQLPDGILPHIRKWIKEIEK